MVFRVMDQRNGMHFMTDEQLRDRVRENSKSNYDWIASAEELTRVTGKSLFDKECMIEIRSRILNCYASLERHGNRGGDKIICNATTMEALQECYNSLADVKKEMAKEARKAYLTELIGVATREESVLSFIYHPGRSFHNFRRDWIKAKYADYSKINPLDFERMMTDLREEWLVLKKEGEERGDFEEDDEKARDEIFSVFRRKFNSAKN